MFVPKWKFALEWMQNYGSCNMANIWLNLVCSWPSFVARYTQMSNLRRLNKVFMSASTKCLNQQCQVFLVWASRSHLRWGYPSWNLFIWMSAMTYPIWEASSLSLLKLSNTKAYHIRRDIHDTNISLMNPPLFDFQC